MNQEMLLEVSNRVLNNQMTSFDISLVHRLFFSYPEVISPDFDVIVVLAGSFLNRIDTAIELYKKYPVPVLISGGSKDKNGQEEWEKYKNYALLNGVLEHDILIEGESTNTYLNLIYSLSILNSHGLKKPIFISSSQHLLRVSLTLNKILIQQGISLEYSLYPSISKNIDKNNWLFSDIGRCEVSSEIRKIIKYELLPFLEK